MCGFWDGSYERGVCGADMMIQVFTKKNKGLGYDLQKVWASTSLDAELGGCAMLLSNLSQWIENSMRER